MAGSGEEAASVCSAAALDPHDWLFPQYRQQGIFFYRNVPIEYLLDQNMGNSGDPAKGRQLPIH